MAISSGAGPHQAWITVDGTTFPVENGSVSQHKTRKTSTFSVNLPLFYPGALEALADLGENVTTIQVLTRGNQQTLFTGETDDVRFDLIGGQLSLTGRDKSAKLHEMKSSEKWQNKLGSDIVQELAGRAGLSASADSSPVQAGKKLEQDFIRLSDNISFGEVIHKIAQMDGARWWVDQNGDLQYRIGNSSDSVYTINYVSPLEASYIQSDAVMLRINRNIQAGKGVKVKVKAWHPRKKDVFEYESNVEGKGGPIQQEYHLPNLLQDHVKQFAKARAQEYANHELTVQATVAGDPSVNVSMGLGLTGTVYFDQVYEMQTVHHTFGMSGHATSISAKSAKDGRSAS